MIFLALIYMAFISLGLPDSLLGSAWPTMFSSFGVSVGNAGYISILVTAGTIVSSLFSHRVINIFGTGKVTVASVAMTAAALLGFSLSPSFVWLLVFAVPLGLGAGAVDSGLNEFVAEHYAAKHMNWLHCFWGIGAMLGPILMSLLLQHGNSWRRGFLCISVIQFVLVALLLLSLPMWRKFEKKRRADQTGPLPTSFNRGLSNLLHTKGAVLAMLTFFLYSSIESTMMLWGASFLVEAKNLSPERAAGWLSLFFLGITAGRAISGFVSMRLSNKALIQLGSGCMLVGLVLLLLPLAPVFSMLAFMIIGLGLAPIFPSMLHQTPVLFGRADAQAMMGTQMAFAYTGATLMPPLFGQLFSHVNFALMPYMLLFCGLALFVLVRRLSKVPEQH